MLYDSKSAFKISVCEFLYTLMFMFLSKKNIGKVLSGFLKLETFLDAFEYELMIVANN